MNKWKRVGRLIFYLTKRQLKKRALWIVFLLFLVGGMLLPEMAQEENNEIKVGLCIEERENYSKEEETELIEKLQTNETHHSLFSFVFYEAEEMFRKEILSGKLECGYVIPTDLWEKLTRGKTRNLVTLYTTSTTTLDSVCNEVVYAALYEEYALDILIDYLIESKELPYQDREALKKVTEPVYRKYLTDGSTFGFQITEQGNTEGEPVIPKETNILLYPMRGFLAVFMLVCGFCGAMMHYEDQEKRIFIRHNARERGLLRFISISIPVFLSYPMVLGSLYASGVFTNWYKEAGSLLFYAVLVILFCGILTYWLKNKVVFCSWIPLLLIGCILFTPVLLDISSFIPQTQFIEKLFVPYYYLRLFL